MKPDKNFKMDKQVKRMLASSRFTKEQSNSFRTLMINAQLISERATVKSKFKQEDTIVD